MLKIEDVRLALGDGLLGERQGAAEGFSAVTNDSRVAQAGELFVALRTEVRDGHDFVADAVQHGVAGVIVEHDEILLPDSVWAFLVPDSRHAIGELARYWRARFPLRAVAITGNVGKTTTKELTAAVLGSSHVVLRSPANFNDEIGLAMTLFQLDGSQDRAVLEVGMFELGEVRRLCEIAQPQTAVVLNVGPTHLERLGTIEAIAAAKAEAVESLSRDGVAILNQDDPLVAAMASKTSARILTFGLDRSADFCAVDIEGLGLDGVVFNLVCMGRNLRVKSPLPGISLVSNALAALAVAVSDGMSLEGAVEALSNAEVPARLQVKEASSGATILDDSYNANPASMAAALDVLAEMPGHRYALLGDMLELGSAEADGHRSIGEYAARVVDALFTVGPRGVMIAAAARAAGCRTVRHFDTKEEAVAVLRDNLHRGDVLLVKASHGLALDNVIAELVG